MKLPSHEEIKRRRPIILEKQQRLHSQRSVVEDQLRKAENLTVTEAQALAKKRFRASKKGKALKRRIDLLERRMHALHKEGEFLQAACVIPHPKPEGRYFRCEACGYLWDDTPPKHF